MRLTVAKKTIVLVVLLFLSVALSSPLQIPRAHGVQTGEVCLADQSAIGSATPCPTSPPLFSGPVGQQVRIGVFIQNSYNVTGFIVVLLADHRYLAATGADLTDTVLKGTPTVILECLRGVKIIGSAPCGYSNQTATTDTIDTLDFEVAGGLAQHTPPGTTGLLFTAIYNITATTPSGGISVGYQTGNVIKPPGCTGSSVPGNVCVTISGGTTTADPETVQGATFDNSGAASMAFVALSASQTRFGPQFPGSSSTARVNATAKNGYPVLFGPPDQVNFTDQVSTGLTVGLSTNSCVTNGVNCSVNVSMSAAAYGNYFVTVFGTYATQDAAGNFDTLIATITLSVVVDDYGFTISQTTITFISGSFGVTAATLSSLNGFAGVVTLSTGGIIPASPPLTVTYTPNPVTLSAGQKLNSTITFKATVTGNTVYHVQIKSASGTRSQTFPSLLTVYVNLGDLTATTLTCVPGTVNVQAPSTCTATVTDTHSSPTTPTGSVSFASGDTGGFSPAGSCSLGPGTMGTATCQVKYTPTAFGSGTHNITATYGGDTTHGASIGFFLLKINVPGPDFNVTANPTNVGPIDVGATGTSTITVNGMNGFTGTVNLSTNPSGGLTAMVNATSVTGTGTSTLSVSATVPGDYTVTVTASNSTVSHSTSVIDVIVVDFSLAANPSALTMGQGAFKTSSISITGVNGFSAAVSLTVVASTGLTATVKPASISGSATATLNVTAGPTLSPGTYNVNVTGMSGSLSRTVEVQVTVLMNNFSMVSTPPTIDATVKANSTSTITVSSIANFAGTVSLSLALPTGVSGSLNPTGLTLTSGGSSMTTLTVNASLAGTFLVNITGTSGSLSHTITVTVLASFASFDISSSPTLVTVVLNATGTSTVTLTGTNGFAGTVDLGLKTNSTNLTCVLSVTRITGGSGTSILSCTGSAAGGYLANVTGTSGSLAKFTVVDFVVTDFALSVSPSSVAANANAAAASTVTIGPLNGFTGTVALTAPATPSGLSCSLTPTSVTLGVSRTSMLSCSGSTGVYTVSVTGRTGADTHTFVVTVTIQDFTVVASPTSLSVLATVKADSTITVAPVNGFTGTVTLSYSATPSGLSCSFSLGSILLGSSQTSTLSCSSSTAQTYTVTVTGSMGSLSHSASSITIAVTDFTFSDSNANPSVVEGTSGTVVLTVAGINGFSGTVTLQMAVTTDVPVNLQPTITLSRTSVTGSGVATINIDAGPSAFPSDYLIVVNATSGPLKDSLSITLTVPRPDFSISRTPQTAIIRLPHQTGVASINVTALNGYNGTVMFSYATSPSGLTCTFSQSSVMLLPGGVNSTVLACSGTQGLYTVTVTGTAVETYVHGITHTAVPVYSVVDFTVAATPNGILANTGEQGHAQINITWTTGYAGAISIAVIPSSSLLTASVSPVSLSGSGLVTLTVSSSTAGVYQVVVNATSGSDSHTVKVSVTVSAVVGPSGVFGLDPVVFYSGVGVVAVAAIAVAGWLLRRGARQTRKR